MRFGTFPAFLVPAFLVPAFLVPAFLVPALLALGCASAPVANPGLAEALRSIAKIEIECGEGSDIRVTRWGRSGYRKGCYQGGLPHGPVVFWEEGYLNLTGSYSDGGKDGDWTVYHGDGTVYLVITFEKGVKKAKRTVNPLPGLGAGTSSGGARESR